MQTKNITLVGQAGFANVIALPTAAREPVRQSWRGRYPKTVSRFIEARLRRCERERLEAQETEPGEFILSRHRNGRLEAGIYGSFSVSKEVLRRALNAALQSLDNGEWDARVADYNQGVQ
ncbi:hypothetical protein SAMN05445850_3156 [Paraburkholderia tuberum]|uniref:Uncharacterized protein n=2 Tax=Paraburkholderia tuberum TaxID=157910 RepID=A0A1H1GZB2_9BURK|nr:hypothetical protein SAMN05445850_3156 [Paraburkholderia tuberum]